MLPISPCLCHKCICICIRICVCIGTGTVICICVFMYIYIWRFPKSWGYPPNHPVVMNDYDSVLKQSPTHDSYPSVRPQNITGDLRKSAAFRHRQVCWWCPWDVSIQMLIMKTPWINGIIVVFIWNPMVHFKKKCLFQLKVYFVDQIWLVPNTCTS